MNIFDIKEQILPTVSKLANFNHDLISGKFPDFLIITESKQELLKYMDLEHVQQIMDHPIEIYCRLVGISKENFYLNKAIRTHFTQNNNDYETSNS